MASHLPYCYRHVEIWAKNIGIKYVNSFNEACDEELNTGIKCTSHIEFEYNEAVTTDHCTEFWYLTVELHFLKDAGGGPKAINKFETAADKFAKHWLKDSHSNLKLVKLDGSEAFDNEGRLRVVYGFTATYSK